MALLIGCLLLATPALRFPSRVVVAGASGRVGGRVVRTLLERTNTTVVALTRAKESEAKLATALEGSPLALAASKSRLEVVQCDLRDEKRLCQLTQGAEAAIWCATGFSEASGPMVKLLGLFNLYYGKSVDIDGIASLGRCMVAARKAQGGSTEGLDVVMCSSAGVTRTVWPEEKQLKFPGAADIPIVRLNPFGILDQKRKSEEALRETGCRYAIVRPTGLNDMWPSGRTVFSQGDIAVGRINREDVAQLLCALVAEPAAAGKTMEAMGMPAYPKFRELKSVLGRLKTDAELEPSGTFSDAELALEYSLLQQLLPGETGDAAALAMGQTYEQLDVGEVGRLGERGSERAPLVREN
ncbi:hypothetical protein T492DRAFT_960675 [Pavlovales sp. CCMP2436]|nr:hypothetical protein T492DRAFT_960675 [Pavlovales sp. CCMP2436]|mmetsp:Transcript_16451/g.41952  ORF Transcript_16451/g.41952 Transcript_16451/m.41952 type:complete len:355 (+) Transcript_16451:84-1148(+)